MQGLGPLPGGLPFKANLDACRFGVGCELQILVSQRVFGMESYHILPIQVSLSTVYNEIYKKCPATDQREILPRGQFKFEPHLH